MFRKRERKIYPPGTFIPTPARICAIIQLCIAFSVLLWNVAQPFTGDLFTIKSHLLLYEDVMGIPQDYPSTEKQERLQRNAERFEMLPQKDRDALLNGRHQLLQQLQHTFLQKLHRSFLTVLEEMPHFEQAWLLLSFIIPIMLLKRVEGASHAVWLLPLLAACYALDNRLYGRTEAPARDTQLFPTEEALIEKYGDKPLSSNIFEQQQQLSEAWNRYLIEVWASQHNDSEQGEHAFNIARLKLRTQDLLNPHTHQGQIREPLALLALYLMWNLFFASITLKSHHNEISRNPRKIPHDG